MQYQSSQSGYSLVEVLVAISILLVAIVGPMTIASQSLQYSQFSAQQNTAFFLAQEGIEAAFDIRAASGLDHLDNPTGAGSWDWATAANVSDCRAANGCGIDWRDRTVTNNIVACGSGACQLYYDDTASRAHYTHVAGAITPFTRVIRFSNISPTVVEVTATVSWEAAGNRGNRSVVLRTYLHDIYDTN